MVTINKYKFKSREDLFDQLLADVLGQLGSGVEKRGVASMLLSGGSTPGILYEKMSQSEFDWKNVVFAPTDERWVAPDDPQSNEKLIRSRLLRNNAVNAGYVSLKSNDPDPVTGQSQVEERIKKIPLPFDIVLLGMGEDGHVASLFPGLRDTNIALDDSYPNLCRGVRREGEEIDRITMTLKCLLCAEQIFLLFYGKKKFEVFEKAIIMKDRTLPVSYVLHQNDVPVSLYWAE